MAVSFRPQEHLPTITSWAVCPPSSLVVGSRGVAPRWKRNAPTHSRATANHRQNPPDSPPLEQFRGRDGYTHAESNDATLSGSRAWVTAVGFFAMHRRPISQNHFDSFGISSGEDPFEIGHSGPVRWFGSCSVCETRRG